MYLSTHVVKNKKKYTILQGGETYIIYATLLMPTPTANKE